MKLAINLEKEIAQLEADWATYKKINPWQLERRINELLIQLDQPTIPTTKGDKLRERLFTIAATALLTLGLAKSPELNLFDLAPKLEQIAPKPSARFSSSLELDSAKPELNQAKPTPNAATKPVAKLSPFAIKVKQVARRIQADPVELLTLISFETEGTLSPSIRGPHVKGQGRAVGLIQFMPATATELGTSVEALAAMTPIEQLDYVEKYLLKRGFKGGTLKNLYSTVFAGHPYARGTISDGYHTLDSAVARMNREHRPRALAILTGQSLPVAKVSKFAAIHQIIEKWPAAFQGEPRAGEKIANYVVTSARGMRVHPGSGKQQFHDGVDLGTPIGVPVFAIADGIIQCGWEPQGGGHYVSFVSPKFPGVRFDLLHLDSCKGKINIDMPVRAGDVIGITGNSGGSTGPHLHLEVNDVSNGKSLKVRAGWLHWFITGKEPK